jgi:AAA15 family ATPase/GTPase
MLTGSFKTHKHHVADLGKVELVKTAAIYGANGAGKSNLIRAFHYMQTVVLEGRVLSDAYPNRFKLDEVNRSKPVALELELCLKNKIYYYGLELFENRVGREFLFERSATGKDILVFERTTNERRKNKLNLNPKYLKTPKDKLLLELYQGQELLQASELFLSKNRDNRYKEIGLVNHWITEKLKFVFPYSKVESLSFKLSSYPHFADYMESILKTLGTGIDHLGFAKVSLEEHFGKDDKESIKEVISILDENESSLFDNDDFLFYKADGEYWALSLQTYHLDKDGNPVSFELEEESDGTQRLLDILPVLFSLMVIDETILIDEIDQSIHPYLLKTFLEKHSGTVETKGQLIFSTHESNLLDLNILRPDEIWFAEKDKLGATQLYSLSDFKPRYDLDIRKGYLNGRFGAIPFLGDFEKLNWQILKDESKPGV